MALKAFRTRIHFTPEIFSQQKYGGITNLFLSLFTEMIRQGVDIRLTSRFVRNEKVASLLGDSYLIPDFIPHRFFDRMLLSVGEMRDRFGFRPGHVKRLVHHTHFQGLFKATDNHVVSFYDMVAANLSTSDIRYRKVWQHQKQCLSKASVIHTISHSVAEELVSRLPSVKDKVLTIYPPVSRREVEYLRPDGAPLFPFVLYVGKREGYKNFQFLAESYAYSDLQQQGVKLICFGGGGFSNQELGHFERIGIRNSVQHVGGNETSLSTLYSEAEVLVIPSLCEGFGMPIVEAMMLNCPLLLSELPVFKEVAGKFATYFDPKDRQALASCLNGISSFKRGYTVVPSIVNETDPSKVAGLFLSLYRSFD